MIANQVIGRSFKGALAYVFGKDGAEFLCSNLANHPENGINAMAGEFLAVCAQRPNLSRNVAHIQMSANPDDELTPELWEAVIKRWMKEMGYENCLYTSARHTDTNNDHVHIVISRVDLDGKTVKENNNYAKNLRVTRELELEFGLIPTVTTGEAKPTPKWQRDKALPDSDYIKEAIKAIGASQPNMFDFIKSLSEIGINAEIKFSSEKGIPQGISFKYNNYSVTGSKIGYSFKNIINKLGVNYEPEHRSAIQRFQAQHSRDAGTGISSIEAPERSPAGGLAGTGRPAPTGLAASVKQSPNVSIGAIQSLNSGIEQRNGAIKSAITEFIKKLGAGIKNIRRLRDFGKSINEFKQGVFTIKGESQRNKSELELAIKVFESTSDEAMSYKKDLINRIKENKGIDNSPTIDR